MEDDGQTTAAGIEALIARLRGEGVEAGRAEAQKLVDAAQARAAEILRAAEQEATETRGAARADSERMRRSGEEALRTAMRDTVLELKDTLGRRFAEDVRGTVTTLMREDDTLRRMVLALAARTREEAGLDSAAALEIVLPRAVVGLDDLRRSPEELREGTLAHFVAAATAGLLREGVTFSRAEDGADGIRMQLTEAGITVDLSDRAVAEVLLRHLNPRFRALLEGVVS